MRGGNVQRERKHISAAVCLFYDKFSFYLGGLQVVCVCVCVIVLQLDLERLWNVVRSHLTWLEEFMCRSEWTFLCVAVWLTVQLCSPPPCVFALCHMLCQFALEARPSCLPWYAKPVEVCVLGLGWYQVLEADVEPELILCGSVFDCFDAKNIRFSVFLAEFEP